MSDETTHSASQDPFKSTMNEKDLEDWQKYQLSLSLSEHSMRSAAMLNYRLTKDFLQNSASKYHPENLTVEEVSHHLRMITSIVSQIEHFSFESWRDARKAKKLANVIVIAALAVILLNLATLIFLILKV